ncbi:hypothetical protein RF11_09219 [Thelohanellus kitauei]|uniref:Retrotransposon gag domain-containing protein n=1 Tax=Thelohanellus kitauei TaxID=669202 RepID=A0A0C2N4D6_THEKT|nr:hypothetical protein RF11_09219 [Thelohanellus kitauei]
MAGRFEKKRNPYVERRSFYKSLRKPEEDVRSFEARLRSSAFHCQYGDNLNDMLRDQFIMGLNDSDVQEKLLSTFTDLKHTLNDAVELAGLLLNSRSSAQSLMTNHVKKVEDQEESAEILKLSAKSIKPGVCRRCGHQGFHKNGEECPAH